MSGKKRPLERRPPNALKLSVLLAQVKRDFRAAARTVKSATDMNDRTVRFSSFVGAAAAYELALSLKKEQNWVAFCNEPFWADHSVIRQANCLRLAFIYMYGSHQGQAARRARKHARALEQCFKTKKTARKAFDHLRKFGFSDPNKQTAEKSQQARHTALQFAYDDGDVALLHELAQGTRAQILVERLDDGSARPKFKIIRVKMQSSS